MAARLTTYVVVAIVAATLIAGLIVGAQRDDNSGPVDLIVHNAKVYTADAHGTMADAVAIRGNKILHVGSEREVMRYQRPQTTVIDAKGAAVLPGFNDAHVAFVDAGLALEEVDLSDAATLADIQQRVGDWAAAHSESAWIVGRGWNPGVLADQPTRAQLDAVERGRPVQLFSQDGRLAWVNTKALQAAGITRRTPDPDGGEIVRDRRREPTGFLRDAAVDLVSRHVPTPGRSERARALRRALVQAQERGITSIQDFSTAAGDLDLFDEARRTGELSVRVYASVPVSSADAAALDELAKRFPDDPLLKTGLAHLESTGMSAQDLQALTTAVDARKWQVAMPATGADQIAPALDALEHAVAANTKRSADRRPRLEGLQAVDDDTIARFRRAHWVASVQPLHMTDGLTSDTANAAPDLSLLRWPLRAFEKMGVALAFGSDAPNVPMAPLAALSAILSGNAGGPEQALKIKSAISGWTSGAAWAEFDDHRKGMIEAGMLADLVILSSNIFDDPATSLATAAVDLTIFDGKVVYRRKSAS